MSAAPSDVDGASATSATVVSVSDASCPAVSVSAVCASGASIRDDLAREYLGRLQAAQPGYTVSDFFQAFPIRQPEHIALIREGFRKAGIQA